ncbi:hypothetical protein AB835_08270 [Candidatus Endobugula sertula]|uniref:Uncharacterized protein n=1 Tax=Candidatus Endobugula sertula TaxID=62101 RepID=A0A1D2QPU2_9GAMM|nr:hypothetical protein AB835_08270 [Candidatus Endobugula sertula]
MSEQIPETYWDPERGRFNSHAFFDTIHHTHICDYSGDQSCDLMLVECRDGRWYIEDNWGGDAQGAKGVFNPYDQSSYPTFFDSMEAAERRAAEVISGITGCDIQQLLSDEDS